MHFAPRTKVSACRQPSQHLSGMIELRWNYGHGLLQTKRCYVNSRSICTKWLYALCTPNEGVCLPTTVTTSGMIELRWNYGHGLISCAAPCEQNGAMSIVVVSALNGFMHFAPRTKVSACQQPSQHRVWSSCAEITVMDLYHALPLANKTVLCQ